MALWVRFSTQFLSTLSGGVFNCFQRVALEDPAHSCAILARIFWVLSWDCKISRYLGIVLRLSLNFIILGIGIEIEIEFWILQYWYWYWYLVLMFLILILRLILKFLSLVSIIGIVSFHKLIRLCNQGVNS